jgi:ribosomal protein L11 methyltransferase
MGAGVIDQAIATVTEALGHLQAFGLRPIGELRTRIVEESDWAEAWKAHFHVMRLGRRLVIKPSWLRHRRSGDEVVIDLDPGMAFGTGLHPTTRLCLEALEDCADRGALGRVLDVGCGSGILSIAAVSLGATRALGVDIDPIAVDATIANARHNRVGRRVRAREGTLPSGEGPFDTVLANLIAGVLIEHAANLADELVRGGTLIASGIFIDREADTRAALERAGFELVGRRQESDWVALEAAWPAAGPAARPS